MAENSNSTAAQSYKVVSDMETDLLVALDLMDALSMMTEAMDEEDACPVQRLVWIAKDMLRQAEKKRGDLFRINHPNRDHFDTVGWP